MKREWPYVLHVISANGTVLGKYTAHLWPLEDENKLKNPNQLINESINQTKKQYPK